MRDGKKEYSRQIILYIGEDELADRLADKWERENPDKPYVIIEFDPNAEPNDPHYSDLADLDENARVYIIGHHAPGLNHLKGGPEDDPITYKEIANIFSAQIHPGNVLGLKISLIACFAGKSPDNNPANSFAGKLHQELREKGFRTNMNARTTMTTVNKDGTKTTSKIGHENELLKKQKKLERKTEKMLAACQTVTKPTEKMQRTLESATVISQNIESLKLRKQQDSKLLFRWGKEGEKKIVDAYAFKNQKHARFFKEASGQTADPNTPSQTRTLS